MAHDAGGGWTTLPDMTHAPDAALVLNAKDPATGDALPEVRGCAPEEVDAAVARARAAAEAWDWGENRDAVFRFAELLKDRETNFPSEVEASPPLAPSNDTH